MKLINRFRTSGGLVFLALMVFLPGQLANADIIHESATMGAAGQPSGWGIDSVWFMGSRFYIAQQVQVTAIGGHILEWTSGNLFGAIVYLDSASDLPNGYPFAGEVVASTVFDPGMPSSDFRTPLSVTLTPGYYALIFGSGRFGSTGGEGALPYVGQSNLPGASFILWDGSYWWNSASERARFVVEGIVNYCDASGSDLYHYIKGVQVGSINNIPTDNHYYADYTSLSTTMVPEVGYPVTVTRGNPWDDVYDKCGLWVDWNQDMDFYDVGEQISMSLGVDPCTFTGTITPPAGAVLGNTRMRTRITWNQIPYPCGNTNYGEVEDYTITISKLYDGGSGTAGDPYLIRTPEQMNAIGANPGDWDKHFMMVADISLGGYTGEEFNIIGDYNNPFSGVFDGSNHVIHFFSYSAWDDRPIGLFGAIRGENAQIKNLGLINPDIDATSASSVGTIAGHLLRGQIINCYSHGGSVSAHWMVGGLVGRSWYFDPFNNFGGHITKCYSTTDVYADYMYAYAGGLVGYNSGLITECFAGGNVEGTGFISRNMGGLVGHTHKPLGGTESGDIRNSYATGAVIGDTSIGGLIGSNAYADITNCYSTGAVVGTPPTAGGFLGEHIVSPYSEGTYNGCFWDIQTSGRTESAGGIGKYTVEMQTLLTFESAGWDFTTPVWQICDGITYPHLSWETLDCPKYDGGSGTAEDPYRIRTAGQMNAIGQNPEDWDKHFLLIAGINLSAYTGEQFNMIGFYDYTPASIPFSGVFDGNNHPIDNFSYNYSGTAQQHIGIFSYVDGANAEFRNVIVINPDVNTGEHGVYPGSLIGLMKGGTVSNCKVNGGTVRASYFAAGGLVGGLMGGLVTQCDCNTFAISSYGSAGGVVGSTSGGIISQCSSAGQTNGEYDVGGITGVNSGQILYCRASGDVNGYQQVGGVVGENAGIIYESFCDGSVTASDHDAGGIAGRNFDEISNCHSTATVTAMNYRPGGLVGLNWDGTIRNCYSAGTVTGDLKGGLVASVIDGVVTDCFWDTEASGADYSAAGTPKTTEQMQTKSTFESAGWDFADIWKKCEGPYYPKLSWESYAAGDGTPNNPCLICSAEEMQAIGANPDDWAKHFKLVTDIDLAGYNGTEYNIIGRVGRGIEFFNGTFDGSDHTIYNFTYATTQEQYEIGLFGAVGGREGAEIKNLTLINPNVDAGSGGGAGSLVGFWFRTGSISNCRIINGTVRGGNTLGGLIGYNRYCTITRSSALVDVTAVGSGNSMVGGLIGYNFGDANQCYSAGSVVADGNVAGGLMGYHNGQVNDCYSTSGVNAGEFVGGLIGYNSGSVTNSYSVGLVNGTGISVYGLIGMEIGTNEACFWDVNTSNQPQPGPGTGKTTTEMQEANTFTSAGWDFVGENVNGTEDIWRLCEDLVNYPKLAWEFMVGDFVCPDGVNFFDYSFFAGHWQEDNCGASNDCDGTDLDRLGTVDINDLGIFTDSWLEGF